MQAAEKLVRDAFIAGFKLDPEFSVSEWADEFRYLQKVSSAEPGKYRSSRTPYLREIMDALSVTSPVQEVVVMKATQLGLTEAANNFVGYIIDAAPGPALMILPTQELARDHSRQKLSPAIRETPKLRGKVRENKARDSANTLTSKSFPGGILFLGGSNSPAGYRAKSVRFLILDDIDGFEPDIGGEGDPVALAKKRADSYGNRKKAFIISTPTVVGISPIANEFKVSDQRYYHVPCPHCGEFQPLEFGGPDHEYGIKFERDEYGAVVDVWYQCRACHGRIDEGEKPAMLEAGKWIPTYPHRKKRGYQISALYSPLGWYSWRSVVEDFLGAKGNAQKLKAWTNTVLGKPWEEAGTQVEWIHLRNRAEPYDMMTVPAGGLLLTAGVDTQDDRLAVSIFAWGRGEESWLIYHEEIYGDPANLEPWRQLDHLRSRSFPNEAGFELQITSMAVDSQGHRTEHVYNYCRQRAPVVMCIQGASHRNRPVLTKPRKVDVNYQGQSIKGGVELWSIGTDTAKSTLFANLQKDEAGPGFIHFPVGLGDEYYRQLTAEKIITRIVRGFARHEWIKTRPRNEALDCAVYAYAAAVRSGVQRMNWDRLEKRIRGELEPDRSPYALRKIKNPYADRRNRRW